MYLRTDFIFWYKIFLLASGPSFTFTVFRSRVVFSFQRIVMVLLILQNFLYKVLFSVCLSICILFCLSVSLYPISSLASLIWTDFNFNLNTRWKKVRMHRFFHQIVQAPSFCNMAIHNIIIRDLKWFLILYYLHHIFMTLLREAAKKCFFLSVNSLKRSLTKTFSPQIFGTKGAIFLTNIATNLSKKQRLC